MKTHLISEIAKTCTSIAVPSHGKLVYRDRIEAMTARYDDDAAPEEINLSLPPLECPPVGWSGLNVSAWSAFGLLA